MNPTSSTVSQLQAVPLKPKNSDRSRVTAGVAERYTVISMNGLDHATIFLTSGQRSVAENWGGISILSSFGQLGYFFNNIGPSTFKQFLSQLNFQYLSEKLFAEQALVFDLSKSIENIKNAVEDALKAGEVSPEDAEEIREALEDAKSAGLSDENSFSLLLQTQCAGSFAALELWCHFATQPNAQAIGFWEEIWAPFIKALKKETSVDSPKVA